MAKKSTKSVNTTEEPKLEQGMLFEENYLMRIHQQLTSEMLLHYVAVVGVDVAA